MTPFAGLRIIEDHKMVETYEDWSDVRSPGRAARRRRQGHPQNIVIRGVPRKDVLMVGDTIVCHPAVAAELRAHTVRAP